MNTNNTSRVIIALYLAKLRECYKVGYKYGDWIDKYSYNNFKFIMSDRKRRRFVTRMNNDKYVKFIANYIKYEYKLSKTYVDVENINECIDYSFYVLRNLEDLLERRILF